MPGMLGVGTGGAGSASDCAGGSCPDGVGAAVDPGVWVSGAGSGAPWAKATTGASITIELNRPFIKRINELPLRKSAGVVAQAAEERCRLPLTRDFSKARTRR